MNRLRRVVTGLATIAVVAALAGCGSGSDPDYAGPAPDITHSATPSGTSVPASVPDGAKVVTVTIGEDSLKASGTRVEVKRNVPVYFVVTAVQSGELHAHSTPGQEMAYPEGTSTGSFVFEQPGIVDVEDHRLNKLAIQVEVR